MAKVVKRSQGPLTQPPDTVCCQNQEADIGERW